MILSSLSTVLLIAVMASTSPVVKVFPPDGATVGSAATIGAELDLTRGERVDPASLQLIVDGTDVTAQARIRQTRDWPPSFVSVTYAAAGLEIGPHHAEIRLRKDGGGTVSHAWRFVVTPR